MKYHFQVHNSKNGYWAECLELPGCRSQGDTLGELKANLREALNLHLSEESHSQLQFAEPLKSKQGRDIIEIEVDPEIELAMRARQDRLKTPEQRTFAGMPVNWDWKNWHKGMWNPEDDTLFPPKRVGIGWTVNFHAVLKKAKLVK